jgi:hypothetical protein
MTPAKTKIPRHSWGEEFARFKWRCATCGIAKHHAWRNRVEYTRPDGAISYLAPPCLPAPRGRKAKQ